MQEGGHQRVGVELPACADLSYRDRVRDIGLAAVAELAEVGGVRESIRVADAAQVRFAEVLLSERGQWCERRDAARVSGGGKRRKRRFSRGWIRGLFADEVERSGRMRRFSNGLRQAGHFPQTCPQTP